LRERQWAGKASLEDATTCAASPVRQASIHSVITNPS
jgi:hypothetical protein